MIKLILNYLLLKLRLFNIEYVPNLTGIKREIPIIISISSSYDDFDKLELVLYSLFLQTTKPDKIILWISDDYELSDLPYNITKFLKKGLQIEFRKNLENYTNKIYAFKEFANSIVVTAENNVYYPRNWLKILYESYVTNPSDIHSHLCKKIKFEQNKIITCEKWKLQDEENSRFTNFMLSEGGVLYPPKSFINEVFREDIFNSVTNENIWLWFMAVLSDRKIRVVKNHIKNFPQTDLINYFCNLKNRNFISKQTDNQAEKLLKLYGSNIFSKLNRENKDL